jgi:uncharacterized membrane protein
MHELFVMGVLVGASLGYALEVLPLVVAVAAMVAATAVWWRH